MTVLHLIRHGQASFGEDNYDRLSARGARQMRILGAHMVATGCRVQAAYSGPLERQKSSATETIQRCHELGANVPSATILPDLSEYDYEAVLASQVPAMIAADPSLENDLKNIFHDATAFQNIFEAAILRWVSGDFDQPGVETWKAFSLRVRKALTDICARHTGNDAVLIFTSGGFITAALQAFLKLPGVQALDLAWQLANASVTRMVCRKKLLLLAQFNATAHLELCREKDLITFR